MTPSEIVHRNFRRQFGFDPLFPWTFDPNTVRSVKQLETYTIIWTELNLESRRGMRR